MSEAKTADPVVYGLHPLPAMTARTPVTGRVCAVCGKRGGSTQGYPTALRWAGLLKDRSDPDFTDKAHPKCIASLDAKRRQLT